MKTTMIAGISAAAVAAGIGLGANQFANAEVSSPSPSASSVSSTSQSSTQHPHGHRGRHHGGPVLDMSRLAKKLSVDETTLAEAISSAREATRPDGRQPRPAEQSQADHEKAHSKHRAAFAKALASRLGLAESKVTAALEELHKQRETARAEAGKKMLEQAVSNGTLSQAEADAVRKAAESGIVSFRGDEPNR